MVTVKGCVFPLMVPLPGETDSQLTPFVVVAVAVKAVAPAPGMEREMVCAGGLALPIWKVTGASEVGLTAMVTAFDMVNVTLTVCELAAPGDERTICPVYIPGCNPVPFTLTLSVAGVLIALDGLTDSQFRPWLTLV